MEETKGIFLTRHIGKTTYKVRVHLSETANETMEDKILRLIRNDGRTYATFDPVTSYIVEALHLDKVVVPILGTTRTMQIFSVL